MKIFQQHHHIYRRGYAHDGGLKTFTTIRLSHQRYLYKGNLLYIGKTKLIDVIYYFYYD